MEEFADRVRQVADLLADLVREAVARPGWSAGVVGAQEVTDAFVAARTVCEAGFLRAVKVEDEQRLAGLPSGRGKSATAHALALRHRVDPAQARRDVAAARALDADDGALSAMAEALLDGGVNRAQVDVAVDVMDQLPQRIRRRVVELVDEPSDDDESSDDDEPSDVDEPSENDDAAAASQGAGARVCTVGQVMSEFLLAQAGRLSPKSLRDAGRHLVARVDPVSADGKDVAADARRGLSYGIAADGCLLARLVVPPQDVPFFHALLTKCGAPVPSPTGVDEAGQEVLIPDERTAAQRRYDVFAAVVRAGAADPDQPIPAGQAVVGVTATPRQVADAARVAAGGAPTASGLATVDGLGPVSATTLAILMCGSVLTRVLLAPRSGAVLDLGRSVRMVSAAQRKALIARDGGCVIPGCDRPAAACQAHHVRAWEDGGATDLDNLCLVCPRHHVEIHLGIWRLLMIDGVAWAIASPSLDPEQRPLRNPVHRVGARARKVGDQLRLALNPPDPSIAA